MERFLEQKGKTTLVHTKTDPAAAKAAHDYAEALKVHLEQLYGGECEVVRVTPMSQYQLAGQIAQTANGGMVEGNANPQRPSAVLDEFYNSQTGKKFVETMRSI